MNQMNNQKATTDNPEKNDAALTSEEYVASGGLKCPGCNSPDNVEGGFIQVDSGIAWQHCSCSECDATWTDQYRLVKYDNLVSNPKSKAEIT